MGLYVHLHVCFSCSFNDGVAKLAAKHREIIGDQWLGDGHREAAWFLEDLALRTGENRGPKGGLSLWGIVGNYTLADEFCDTLRPFWLELLSGNIDGGPCSHAHINVFCEREQTEATDVYEIWLDEDKNELVIKEHKHMPFKFNQF